MYAGGAEFYVTKVYMAESEVNKRIREAYEESGGSKKQVHKLVNVGKEKGDKTKIIIGQVRQRFL